MLRTWGRFLQKRSFVCESPSDFQGGGRLSNHYAVLGVSENASTHDIVRAFHRIAVKNHPDMLALCSEEELEKSRRFLQKAQESCNILRNVDARARYDAYRQRQMKDRKHEIRESGNQDFQQKMHLSIQRHFERGMKLRAAKDEDRELFKKMQANMVEEDIKQARSRGGGAGFYGFSPASSLGVTGSKTNSSSTSSCRPVSRTGKSSSEAYEKWQERLRRKRMNFQVSSVDMEELQKRVASQKTIPTGEFKASGSNRGTESFTEDRIPDNVRFCNLL